MKCDHSKFGNPYYDKLFAACASKIHFIFQLSLKGLQQQQQRFSKLIATWNLSIITYRTSVS